MPPSSTTYLHPSPRTTILPLLRAHHLPTALPVVRRLQFHFVSPHSIALASFPPVLPPGSGDGSARVAGETENGRVEEGRDAAHTTITVQHRPTGPFAVLLMDRSRAPETEAWLFSSAEGEAVISPVMARTARAQLLAVFAHAKGLELPGGYPDTMNPHVMKLGSVHAVSLALLQGWAGGAPASLVGRWVGGVGVVDTPAAVRKNGDAHGNAPVRTSANGAGASSPAAEPNGAATPSTASEPNGTASATHPRGASRIHAAERAEPIPGSGAVVLHHTIPYAKYIIPPSDAARVGPAHAQLPAGLVWDRVRATDYRLVVSRTNIPRTPRTLALMPGACVRIAGRGGAVAEEGASWLQGTATEDEPSPSNGNLADNETRDWHPDTAHTLHRTTAGRPVGWAFLGPDASLATLHVEEDYRGKGLGKLLGKRTVGLLGPHGDGDGNGNVNEEGKEDKVDSGRPGDDSTAINEVSHLSDPRLGFPLHRRRAEAWAHADVARGNAPSVAVVSSMGGREGWECFWVVVDLDRAGIVLRGEGEERDGREEGKGEKVGV